MAGSVADLLGGGPGAAPGPAAPPPGFVVQQDNAAPPPPPGFVAQDAAPKDSGMAANLAQGFVNEGLQNSGEMIRDALLNPRALYDRIAGGAVQAVGGHAASGPQSLQGLASLPADIIARKQSNSVVAATPGERIGRVAAAGAAAGVINPESLGATVAQLLFGGASGLGSGALAEVAPDNLKPAAAILGGAIAPAAGHLAHPLAQALAPFIAPVSEGAAKAAAGAKLASAATDPGAVAAALEQPAEIVPGSEPTTYQQTGDPGLGQLERQAATADPAAFQQRAAEQNSARRAALRQGPEPFTLETLPQQLLMVAREHGGFVPDGALSEPERQALAQAGVPKDEGYWDASSLVDEAERRFAAKDGSWDNTMSPYNNAHIPELQRRFSERGSGDPNDLAKALKQQFDDINAEHEAAVQQATTTAQDRAATALGPEAHPDEIGANVRQALDEANSAAKAREGALWKAVDPDGNMVGNVSTTIQAAHDIPAEMAKTAKPMQAEEAAVFDAAQNLSSLSPVSDLIGLRSRVSAELRQQTGPQGDPQALRRLTMLRGAIEDNLSHTISQEIANEAHKAKAGIIDPSGATAARLQSWLNEWQTARQSGPAGGAGLSLDPVAGPAGGAGVLRAESPAAEGSGSPATASGIPQPAIFDQAARERLNAASAATAQRARTFKAGPVGDVLAEKGGKGQYRLPDGQVAAKFFKPDATGFQRMQALLATGAPDALPTIERFAANTLRRNALRPDGTLDPARFAKWQKDYADSLRALPEETRAKYAAAAHASETLADVQAERAETLKAAQQGAIGKIMGLSEPQDVVKAVGQVLNGSTPIADMKALARATASDPVARQGLRRAVTDHIASKFVGNTEAGTTGETKIKADAYQTFVRQNRSALHLIFSPEEVRSMEAVAEDLQRAARSQNTKLPGGSNTAQDQAKTMKALATAGQKTWLEIVGGVLGSHFGPLGTVAGIAGAHLIRSLRAAGVNRIDNLVSEAMLNPKLARELLKKAPQNTAHWSAAAAPLTAALWSANQPKKEQP